MLRDKIVISWLKQLLSDGPVPVLDIFARSKTNGVSRDRLKRIKAQIGIKSIRMRKNNEMVCAWIWPYKNKPLFRL